MEDGMLGGIFYTKLSRFKPRTLTTAPRRIRGKLHAEVIRFLFAPSEVVSTGLLLLFGGSTAYVSGHGDITLWGLG